MVMLRFPGLCEVQDIAVYLLMPLGSNRKAEVAMLVDYNAQCRRSFGRTTTTSYERLGS